MILRKCSVNLAFLTIFLSQTICSIGQSADIGGCYSRSKENFNKHVKKSASYGAAGTGLLVGGIVVNVVPIIGQAVSGAIFLGMGGTYVYSAHQVRVSMRVKKTRALIRDAYKYIEGNQSQQGGDSEKPKFVELHNAVNALPANFLNGSSDINENTRILSKIILKANKDFAICRLKVNPQQNIDESNKYKPYKLMAVDKILLKIKNGDFNHYREEAIREEGGYRALNPIRLPNMPEKPIDLQDHEESSVQGKAWWDS